MFGCYNEYIQAGTACYCSVLPTPQVVYGALYYEKHEFCTENLMTFDSCDYYGGLGVACQ